MAYRGANALIESGADRATEQKRADVIGDKGQRIRKAAATAKRAKDLADDHDAQLSTGVLEQLDLGEMALLNRLNGQLPNRNLATLEDATKIGDGVVAARAMLAQDAAAFNLWAGNAMIRNAKIDTMVVDKLGAGTFTAGDIILAGGGQIRAGGTVMDSTGYRAGGVSMTSTGLKAGQIELTGSGMYMPPVDSWRDPAANREYKITSAADNLAIGFFSDPEVEIRGIGLRAEGAGLSRAGSILMNALTTKGDTLFADGSAWVHINANNARGNGAHVYVGKDLRVDRDLQVKGFSALLGRVTVGGAFNPQGGIDPSFTAQSTRIGPNGSWAQWDHGLGTSRVWPHFQLAVAGDNLWRPLESQSGVNITTVGAQNIRIYNDMNVDCYVRGWVMKMVDI